MTNNNTNDMHFDLTFSNVAVENSKEAFQYVTNQISKLIGTPEKTLFGMLMEREETQNSGVGHGVAILDAKLPRLTRPIILFLKLNQAINYQAADGEPVDMITLVLSPEFENFEHLRRISKVARFFSNTEARDAMRQAEDYNDVRHAVDNINQQRRAAA